MIGILGHWFNKKVKNFFYAMGFFYQILRETLLFVRRKQVAFKVLVLQIYFTGVNALSIITFIALAMGVVIILQGITILPQFGQGDLIYIILTTIITRELGPILTAFIVIARSGTAIATELGHMVVTHQMEAYISVGISPVSYLIVPRFLGVIISLVILTIYFNVIGLFASFFITQLIKPIQFMEYFQNLIATLKVSDIIVSLVKSFVFGIIISTVATYHAFTVKIAATEIPQVVIKAVGQGFVLCIIANVIITILYYFFRLG
ncbi:MAG: ABC transporter permease [Spirochaetales bacterium]|nr:ABC transporter permease [Spirochaetales bacterium]